MKRTTQMKNGNVTEVKKKSGFGGPSLREMHETSKILANLPYRVALAAALALKQTETP